MREVKRTFEWIPVDKLHSGLAYQRPINEDFVKEAVENFDKNEIEAPCVSLRVNENGQKEYRVVDGQHTITIVKCVGWTKIRCEVREGLTPEEENEWFYKKNTKKRSQTSRRLFNSKLNGKFDQATNCLINALDSVGYKIKTVDTKTGKGVIDASVTIENIFKELGENDFTKFIKLHKHIWDGDKKSITAPFLNGMSKFYNTYKADIDVKRFDKAFINKRVTAYDIIKDVNNSMLKNKNNSIKYAWALVEHYNKGLKEDNKLKFSKLED